jgi:hypothetical protein
MLKSIWFLPLLLGLPLAVTAGAGSGSSAGPRSAGVKADSSSAADSTRSKADSSVVADSAGTDTGVPQAPAAKDTIRAGDMIIVGDVIESSEDARERKELKETLVQLGAGEVPGARQWERRKVPTTALYSSALLPGLGQIYNGRRIKVGLAAGFFSVYLAGAWLHWKDAQSWTAYRDNLPEDAPSSVVNYANQQISFHKESSRDFVWWTAAIWVINMLDAWIDAHLFDLRAYTPPADLGGAPGTPEIAPRSSGRPVHYLTYTVDF